MVPLALSRLTSPISTVNLKPERPDSALPVRLIARSEIGVVVPAKRGVENLDIELAADAGGLNRSTCGKCA
jgi:hypothetical protein